MTTNASNDTGSTTQANLGTITGGLWNATIIGPAYGGTGVANSATITVGGNLSFVGSYTCAVTLSGNTSVTFPTSGTLATTAQIPTFPVSLTNGGTGASLSAAVNSLVYSTNSALALLNTGDNGVLITSNSGVPSIFSSTLPSAIQSNITATGTLANLTVTGTVSANVLTQPGTAVTSAAGSTVLSVTSTVLQTLTGSTTQSFVLPNAETLVLGQYYEFENNSTGALTVKTYTLAQPSWWQMLTRL